MNPPAERPHPPEPNWLDRTVLGVGLASLANDWGQEMATALLPALLVALGAGPGWLGAIEGVSDGLSGFVKLAAGDWTDRLRRRKPLVVAGYALTAAATGSLAFAASALQVMAVRCVGWLVRGVRTPGKKALLAAGVPREAYGRAFGFERMMDTLGAVAGPVTALWLLNITGHNYHRVFLWALLPGGMAAVLFGLLVRERPATPAPGTSFLDGLRSLPSSFRWFLVSVGVFGLGDFSHTLLILYATRALAPSLGMAAASSLAVGLYLVHNGFYAGSAYAGGWLGDQSGKRKLVLAGGYAVAAAMAAVLVTAPAERWALGVAFALGGTFVGVVEALQDTLAAEMVPPAQHGMAFGTMAAVNAVGDLGSSLLIGTLWSFYSPVAGFAVAGALFFLGMMLLFGTRVTA